MVEATYGTGLARAGVQHEDRAFLIRVNGRRRRKLERWRDDPPQLLELPNACSPAFDVTLAKSHCSVIPRSEGGSSANHTSYCHHPSTTSDGRVCIFRSVLPGRLIVSGEPWRAGKGMLYGAVNLQPPNSCSVASTSGATSRRRTTWRWYDRYAVHWWNTCCVGCSRFSLRGLSSLREALCTHDITQTKSKRRGNDAAQPRTCQCVLMSSRGLGV